MQTSNLNFFVYDMFVLLCSITFFVGILWFVNFRVRRRKIYKCMAKLPGDDGFPLLGHALEFGAESTELIKSLLKWREKYGGLFKLWLGPDPNIVISKPHHLSTVLNCNKALDKGVRFKQIGDKMLNEGVLMANYHKWKPRRKLIQSTFSPKILESFVPIFVRQSEILVEQLKKEVGKGSFDAWTYLSKTSLDTICGTAMGVEMNSQITDSSYLHAATTLLEIIGLRSSKVWMWIDFLFFRTKYGDDFLQSTETMKNFTEKIIVERKKKISNEECYNIEDIGYGKNPGGRAFLDYFIEITRFDETITIKDVKDEVDTIMLTGYETTAGTFCFCALALGMHQDIQQTVFEEVYSIFGDSDRSITYDDLQYLKYTEMFIKETLRQYPIVWIYFRDLQTDLILDDYLVPSGSTMIISPLLAHTDHQVWPNPRKFDPLRFTPEECAKRHPYSFIPFGGGPRNCVGFRYAMLSLKATMVNVIRKYKIFTDITEQTLELTFKTTLKPTSGYQIRIESRK